MAMSPHLREATPAMLSAECDPTTIKTRWPDLMLPASRSAWRAAKARWAPPSPARGQVPEVERDHLLGRGCVLSEGAVAGPEHLVARLKLGHVLADRLNRSSNIHTANTNLWRA
jgi:hypothetical protein